MPQANLESVVCTGVTSFCGGDPKVACESTLIRKNSNPNANIEHQEPEHYDPDIPPESYQISIAAADLDWLDISAVYERGNSTKGTTNPKSSNHHQQQQQHPSKPPQVLSTSQRFSGNLKAPIIGLPNTIQHSGYLGHSARRLHGVRIFPQKGVKVSEPGSPKVSCFGKVLSGRETRSQPKPEAKVGGWCLSFRAIFGWCGRRKEKEVVEGVEKESRTLKKESRVHEEVQVVGLGGMKRFVSGRRAASWGGDVEVDFGVEEERHVPWSGPLNR